jgi:hypothetical protein
LFVTDIEKIFGSKASSAIESIKKTTETTFSVERTVVGRFAGISEKASIEITSNYTIKGMINGEKMMTVTGTLIKTTGLPPAAVKGAHQQAML